MKSIPVILFLLFAIYISFQSIPHNSNFTNTTKKLQSNNKLNDNLGDKLVDTLNNQKLIFTAEKEIIGTEEEFIEYEGIYKIIVAGLVGSDTLQILKGNIYRISFEEIEFADANFDGIQDILVMTNYSYSGRNNEHDIWIYDTIKKCMFMTVCSLQI